MLNLVLAIMWTIVLVLNIVQISIRFSKLVLATIIINVVLIVMNVYQYLLY